MKIEDLPQPKRNIPLGRRIAADFGICTSRIDPTPKDAYYNGKAHVDGRIECQWPTMWNEDIYTLCHEIGHQHLKHHISGKPKWQREYEAEKFARKLCRQYGVSVGQWRHDAARQNVRDHLTKSALAGELSDVPKSVLKWAKWGVAA